MQKLKQAVAAVRGFVVDVQAELRKCAWPTRQELWESTVVVILASVLLGAFVGVSDFALVKFLGTVIR